ncbi:MAG: Gfo/Idh/MocA family oxidoreductase, partial [Planctomycetes bacterium]|nr:Gfo/Idh/MocA family oxidoreductase [Planctomycetota bacterium]
MVGLHGRGGAHIQGFGNLPNVRVVALCDVDSAVLDARVTAARKADSEVRAFADVRAMLDSGICDAVAVATPNHSHALIGIWAAERGLHSYIEKPVAHDVWQGRQLVAAAAKHGVCIQTGSQCRSLAANHEAMAYLRGGELGAIELARGLCYKRRKSIGKVAAPRPVPETVDYDLWLGPALLEPVRRTQFHYDWHWQWNYGNGDLGNQG